MNALFQTGDKSMADRRNAWRRRLRRVVELFPWTPLGVALTAAAYAALEWVAYAELDLVWLVVGYAGLGLTLICPFLVLAVAAWLKLRGALPSPTDTLVLQTGQRTRTGFALRFPRFVPLVQVDWRFHFPLEIAAEQERKGGHLLEAARAGVRGRFDRIARRVRVFDALGLSRVVITLSEPRRVDVLPSIGGLRHLPSLTGFASGDALPHPMGLEDGDRVELQRYVPGDPARFIHWKVFGRTRRLMVRMPERALTVARRTAAFFVGGEGDDASAAVARLALEKNLLGGEWIFATDDNPKGTDQRAEALDLLMRSADVGARGGESLEAFVQHVERQGPASLIVFAPPRPGPWLERLNALARRKRPRVVIGVDGISQPVPRPLWRRLLALSPSQPQGTPARELEQVIAELSRSGAQVAVFDRGSGQPLSHGHREAMLRFAPAGGT